MPDRMPEDMPDRMLEDMPDKMPECQIKCQKECQKMLPDTMPEDLPDRMPGDMQDRMPERSLPVKWTRRYGQRWKMISQIEYKIMCVELSGSLALLGGSSKIKPKQVVSWNG